MTMFPKDAPERLDGPRMTVLRCTRFIHDGGRCVDCGRRVSLEGKGVRPRMHLAHVTGRGANGADTFENTRTKCPECHLVQEHSGGGKVIRSKGE